MKDEVVKKGERTYIQRQYIRWSKYWLYCKDPKKKNVLFKQSVSVGDMMLKEMQDKQRE